jgi:predicted ester cyclase
VAGYDLKALTLEGFERMFNQGEIDYVDRALAAGATDHQEPLGADFAAHLKDVIGIMRTAFPDLRFEVHEMIREGDTVASRSTMTGTHRARFAIGPFAALEPSGAAVAVPHMHFFRYRGDRLVDLWHVWDTGALMRQISAPGPAGVAA